MVWWWVSGLGVFEAVMVTVMVMVWSGRGRGMVWYRGGGDDLVFKRCGGLCMAEKKRGRWLLIF